MFDKNKKKVQVMFFSWYVLQTNTN